MIVPSTHSETQKKSQRIACVYNRKGRTYLKKKTLLIGLISFTALTQLRSSQAVESSDDGYGDI
jgi:hypothetical protein